MIIMNNIAREELSQTATNLTTILSVNKIVPGGNLDPDNWFRMPRKDRSQEEGGREGKREKKEELHVRLLCRFFKNYISET